MSDKKPDEPKADGRNFEDENSDLKRENQALRRLVLALGKRLDEMTPSNLPVTIGRQVWVGLFAGLALPQVICDADPDDTMAQVCETAVAFGDTLVERLWAHFDDCEDDDQEKDV